MVGVLVSVLRGEDSIMQAELTLFYTKVKYRGPEGHEKEAMQMRPYGMVRFKAQGEERQYVTPVTISYEGQATEATYDGNQPGSLRIFLEPAPVEDGVKWMHSFGPF